MKETKADSKPGIIPFTIFVAIVSSALFIYLYLGRQSVPEPHGFFTEFGEVLGNMGIYALVLIYGRSLLKLILNDGTLWQRFIPEDYQDSSASISRKVLDILNRTHKYVGVSALAIFPGHALLMGTARWNIFLEAVLVLLVWQGLFGLFLVTRFSPASLRKYGYLVHAQLFSGSMIGIFAAFGHLLV